MLFLKLYNQLEVLSVLIFMAFNSWQKKNHHCCWFFSLLYSYWIFYIRDFRDSHIIQELELVDAYMNNLCAYINQLCPMQSVFFPLSLKGLAIEKACMCIIWRAGGTGQLTGSGMANVARSYGKLELNWWKRKKEILGNLEIVF